MGTGTFRRNLGLGYNDTIAMKGWHIIMALLLAGCGKDEVDVSTMTNNPFDQEYQGPQVIELVDAYVETINVPVEQPNGQVTYEPVDHQVIEVRVRQDLFLSPASYQVGVTRNGQVQLLNPEPPGSDRFKYKFAPPAPGVPVCADYRLMNNFSGAVSYGICATL